MGTKNNPGNYDCYEKAADDEPIFILRANDPLAPKLVRKWVAMDMGEKKHTKKTIKKWMNAVHIADDMEKWKRKHVLTGKEAPDSVPKDYGFDEEMLGHLKDVAEFTHDLSKQKHTERQIETLWELQRSSAVLAKASLQLWDKFAEDRKLTAFDTDGYDLEDKK